MFFVRHDSLVVFRSMSMALIYLFRPPHTLNNETVNGAFMISIVVQQVLLSELESPRL